MQNVRKIVGILDTGDSNHFSNFHYTIVSEFTFNLKEVFQRVCRYELNKVEYTPRPRAFARLTKITRLTGISRLTRIKRLTRQS